MARIQLCPKQLLSRAHTPWRPANMLLAYCKSWRGCMYVWVSVNGALSDITDVTSGVPQGSVLGPILFLPYINDINENIQSSIRLFADDSIIYRKINSNIDHQILQTDLIQLEKWSDKWQMQFNIDVCTFQLQTKLNQTHTSIRYLDTRFLK